MTGSTILIVDDDPEITDALARGLQMHGYTALTESTVRQALVRIAQPDVTAAILDVMIGLESGIDLVREIRAAGITKPVLMLSALAEVEDRTAGLEAGADDYIVKPFSFDELVARLKVQEQRAKAILPKTILDQATRSVHGGQRSTDLTEREFALLEMLHTHSGQVLSRGEIFDALWASEGTSSENIVDVYVGYLRKKLNPSSEFGFDIRTIRNKGFILEPHG